MKYIISGNGNVSAFVKGVAYSFTPETKNYQVLIDSLERNDAEAFVDSLVNEKTLNRYCQGYISFKGEVAYWDGVPMPDLFADRVLELVDQGYDFGPMINFTVNLSENPSDQSILEMIDFLRNKNLPLTRDGCFIGYKLVRPDYKDVYTGTIDNSVGSKPSVKRDEVDPNRDRECSTGLHVGGLGYINWYRGQQDGDQSSYKVVLVKVNPKDVVSVPTDHKHQKLRCCTYEVIANFDEALPHAVYDDMVFLDKKAEPVVEVEKPAGWVENLKGRFARILELVKGKRNA
jgi:hypothetical protein